MAKHIGIVAMSYEGAALCYQTVCAEAASLMGEHLHPEITLHSFPLGQYMKFVSKLDWEGTAQLLLQSVNKVERAGANFAICPANTAHEAFDLMTPHSPIPLLHIADVVADAASRQGCSKLGILGTKFLMEGKVYSQILSQRGIGIVVPTLEQREHLNTLILEELVKGILKDSTRQYFLKLVADLTEKGCDAVVMACTEIPLILKPDDVETPLLDSTRLLAAAALKEALRSEA